MYRIIHNAETNEISRIELSDKEIKIIEESEKNQKIEEEKRQLELAAKAAARQAILDRLGLTEEEARLLLG